MTKIAIIAGTPIDVAFGVNYFSEKLPECTIIGHAISKNPRLQTDFQQQDAETIHQYIKAVLEKLQEEAIACIVVYCNSLSSTLDVERLMFEVGVPIITPLSAYQSLATTTKRVALVSANAISLYNVTRFLEKNNPEIEVIGYCALPLVEAIETKISAKEIIENFGVRALFQSFIEAGVEQIILGCTHLDYLEAELTQKFTAIYSPSQYMLEQVRFLI